MRSRPEDIGEDELAPVLRTEWQLDVQHLDYLPEGGGAYHWTARGADGRRWFVTCDDLDTKPWLGPDREAVYAGLLTTYQAAIDLRSVGGLMFVAAPVPSRSGRPATRIDDRYSLAVFPYIDGRPGRWGEPISHAERDRLVEMLARLHRSTTAVHAVPRRGMEVPAHQALAAALQALDERWGGGPLAEPARSVLAEHRDVVARWLSELDRVATELQSSESRAVITHGEPHPGNLIHVNGGLALVDWDTVALARPERDLWMLDDEAGAVRAAYLDHTGQSLDPLALDAYRLLWALADVAAFTGQLRGPHIQTTDTERALAALHLVLTTQEPAPYGAGLAG